MYLGWNAYIACADTSRVIERQRQLTRRLPTSLRTLRQLARSASLVALQVRVSYAQQPAGNSPPLAALQQISNHVVGFHLCVALHVAEHGSNQRRTLRSNRLRALLQKDEAWRKALTSCDGRALGEQVVASPAAPAATMSPMLARIRQVMPAQVAMNTHFSHISWQNRSRSARGLEVGPENAVAIASTRGAARSIALAKRQKMQSLRCTMRPPGSSMPEITHSPPRTRRPEALVEHIQMPHAIQQRQDRVSAAQPPAQMT